MGSSVCVKLTACVTFAVLTAYALPVLWYNRGLKAQRNFNINYGEDLWEGIILVDASEFVLKMHTSVKILMGALYSSFINVTDSYGSILAFSLCTVTTDGFPWSLFTASALNVSLLASNRLLCSTLKEDDFFSGLANYFFLVREGAPGSGWLSNKHAWPSTLDVQEDGTKESHSYQQEGYVGPVRFEPLYDAKTIQSAWQDWLVRVKERTEGSDGPKIWDRSAFLHLDTFQDIGADPQVVNQILEGIGGPAKLCALVVAERLPKESHLFHVDVECAQHDKCAVVVMAVDHGEPPEALQVEVLPRSHLLSEQGLIAMNKVSPGDPSSPHFGAPVMANATEEGVGFWRERLQQTAGPFTEDARFQRVPLLSSEFLVLDGKTWHGSWNLDTGSKVTIVMVYVPLDSTFKRPLDYKWPYSYDETALDCMEVYNSS